MYKHDQVQSCHTKYVTKICGKPNLGAFLQNLVTIQLYIKHAFWTEHFLSVTECLKWRVTLLQIRYLRSVRLVKQIVCLCRWVRERFEDEYYAKLIGKF